MNNNLLKQFGDRIKGNVDLSPYFTLKMKTRAEFYIEVSSIEEWQEVISFCSQNSIRYFILGGGSNIAVTQELIPGLVIRNRYIAQELIEDTQDYVLLRLSSGYPIGLVVKETTEAGYAGFQHHLGLPGTLGGAVYMNSKWTKPLSYVGDHLVSARILTGKAEIKEIDRDYFSFAYDYSKLQDTGEIFLDGVFKLKKDNPEVLEQQAQEALQYRKETQPFGVATGGCFFQNIPESIKTEKNLPTTSAGYLIDKSGLKGTQVGAFVVSDKHANFVINTGGGKPADLQKILALIKSTVYAKFGVELEEEVRVI